MKLSKPEFFIILLSAAFLSFFSGWMLQSRADARPVRVEVEYPLGDREAVQAALPGPTTGPTAAPAPALGPGERVNINTAGVERLMLLPGIGEKRAEDIVAYREEHGPFRIAEDLTRVSGIGEGTLAGLIDYITVEDET